MKNERFGLFYLFQLAPCSVVGCFGDVWSWELARVAVTFHGIRKCFCAGWVGAAASVFYDFAVRRRFYSRVVPLFFMSFVGKDRNSLSGSMVLIQDAQFGRSNIRPTCCRLDRRLLPLLLIVALFSICSSWWGWRLYSVMG